MSEVTITVIPTLTPVQKKVRRHVSNIISNLDQIEETEALLMSIWLLEKSKYYKQHYKSNGFGAIPKQITKGDIVRVDFGINVGDEYSDKGQDLHFALVWAQKGFVFVVIPLTKTPQTKNDFGVNLGTINGLPESVDTWAKLEALKSVSIRRMKRMEEHKDGKISIKDDETKMNLIKNKFKEKFLSMCKIFLEGI